MFTLPPRLCGIFAPCSTLTSRLLVFFFASCTTIPPRLHVGFPLPVSPDHLDYICPRRTNGTRQCAKFVNNSLVGQGLYTFIPKRLSCSAQNGQYVGVFPVKRSCLLEIIAKVLRLFLHQALMLARLDITPDFCFHQALILPSRNGRRCLEIFCIDRVTTPSCLSRGPPPPLLFPEMLRR